MDAIFIAHQLQEKYITAKKPLYFAYPHDSDYNPDLDQNVEAVDNEQQMSLKNRYPRSFFGFTMCDYFWYSYSLFVDNKN